MRIFSFVLIGILSILATTAHATRTGTMGQAEGSPAALSCPNKNYLAGFAVQWDTVLSGLQPYCVDMASDGAWSGDFSKTYSTAMALIALQMPDRWLTVLGGDNVKN